MSAKYIFAIGEDKSGLCVSCEEGQWSPVAVVTTRKVWEKDGCWDDACEWAPTPAHDHLWFGLMECIWEPSPELAAKGLQAVYDDLVAQGVEWSESLARMDQVGGDPGDFRPWFPPGISLVGKKTTTADCVTGILESLGENCLAALEVLVGPKGEIPGFDYIIKTELTIKKPWDTVQICLKCHGFWKQVSKRKTPTGLYRNEEIPGIHAEVLETEDGSLTTRFLTPVTPKKKITTEDCKAEIVKRLQESNLQLVWDAMTCMGDYPTREAGVLDCLERLHRAGRKLTEEEARTWVLNPKNWVRIQKEHGDAGETERVFRLKESHDPVEAFTTDKDGVFVDVHLEQD